MKGPRRAELSEGSTLYSSTHARDARTGLSPRPSRPGPGGVPVHVLRLRPVRVTEGAQGARMANPQREQLQGKGDQLIGGAKGALGRATDDERTQAEGEAQQEEGKAREAVGSAREKLSDAADDLKRTVTGD